MLRGLWLQRLPIQVRTCLATVKIDEPLSKLAEIADNVMESFLIRDSHQIQSINSSSEIQEISESQKLRDEIKILTRQIKELGSTHSRSTNHFQPIKHKNQNNFCWYHSKFGSKATKCIQPCSFLNSKNE